MAERRLNIDIVHRLVGPTRRCVLAIVLLAVSVPALALDAAYAGYGRLLTQSVQWSADGHASSVDYTQLQQQRAALDAVLAEWSSVGQAEFDGWTRAQQMAFLINAYNGFTLQLILSRYPKLQSIRDLGSVLRSPWKQPFFVLLGQQRTLDWIEHEQLRPRYRDERIHFAINCASVGCPALRPEPYVAAQLDAQLDDQQRRYLGDRRRHRYDAATRTLQVQAIYQWFADDFSRNGGSVAAWFAQRADLLSDTESDRVALRRADVRIEYLDYDWALNDSRAR